jgi:hypothetical protein
MSANERVKRGYTAKAATDIFLLCNYFGDTARQRQGHHFIGSTAGRADYTRCPGGEKKKLMMRIMLARGPHGMFPHPQTSAII